MPPKIGQQFRGRYQVLKQIGEGAFATVFHARDESGREVALKVLKEPYREVKDVVERFQREVFAVASIDSPHVVKLLDFGFSDGSGPSTAPAEHGGLDEDFYIVMEFVRGLSLRELMRRREWTPVDVLVIVGQIAHALEAAHRQEIVHRDLKPENVMLVDRGDGAWQVKVLDFGFAKLPELERKLDLRPLTRVGFCFGTPQYLSPEQIRGQAIDGGADLFALGVLTYEMLAGRRPWDGEDARSVMLAVLKQLPPAVVQLHPDLMARLEEVNRFLLRSLEKERAERPRDPVAFFEELETALYGSPAAAAAALADVHARIGPTGPTLDQVSSRAIALPEATPREPSPRGDNTEIGLGARVRERDTLRQRALETDEDTQISMSPTVLPSGSPTPLSHPTVEAALLHATLEIGAYTDEIPALPPVDHSGHGGHGVAADEHTTPLTRAETADLERDLGSGRPEADPATLPPGTRVPPEMRTPLDPAPAGAKTQPPGIDSRSNAKTLPPSESRMRAQRADYLRSRYLPYVNDQMPTPLSVGRNGTPPLTRTTLVRGTAPWLRWVTIVAAVVLVATAAFLAGRYLR